MVNNKNCAITGKHLHIYWMCIYLKSAAWSCENHSSQAWLAKLQKFATNSYKSSHFSFKPNNYILKKKTHLFITPRFRYYILCTAWTAVTFRFSETSSESRILPFQCMAVHVIHPILPSHWWCHQVAGESKRTRIRPKKIWLHELLYTKIVKI